LFVELKPNKKYDKLKGSKDNFLIHPGSLKIYTRHTSTHSILCFFWLFPIIVTLKAKKTK